MPLDEDDHLPEQDGDGAAPPERWSRWKISLLVVLGALLFAAALGWLNREKVADSVIAGQLADLGIPATYTIREISGGRQVLENVVVGDPARPDLTVERVEVRTVLRFGLPQFASVTLVRPRLYGSLRNGRLSFGSLDPLIYTDSKEPFELPDLDLAIRDGRGLVESDYGRLGIKTQGAGGLRGGYSGILAVAAPSLAHNGCVASEASLYGKVSVKSAIPRFEGPLRIGEIACGTQQLKLGKSAAQLMLVADPRFDGGEARLALAAGPLEQGANRVGSLAGTGRLSYRRNALVAEYKFAGKGLSAPQARLATLVLEGRARAGGGLARIDLEGSLKGEELAIGGALDAALASAAKAGQDTLVQPVVNQIRTSLSRERQGSTLLGSFVLRLKEGGASLVVPNAALRGGSGETLVSVSRLQIAMKDNSSPLVSGNFATGGSGLPKLAGRMEGGGGARLAMNIRMPEYRAGKTSIALPRLLLVQQPGGALGFAGEALVSGAIPGGRIEALRIPLEGNWSDRAGLSVWRQCVELRFARLELAGLGLERNRLPVCPPRGGAIVRGGDGGVRLVAGLPGLDLSGRLGASPVRISTGPAALAYPGKLTLRDVTVALGAPGNVSDFRIGRLDGQLGASLSGHFADARMLLAAVPLDLFDAAGAWRFGDGVLALGEASFRLEDREQVDRFQPLVARDAALVLADGAISAEARLREPQSMREIVRTVLRHDLGTATGSAELVADGVRFDRQVQPDTLTYLALGVIANAQGELRGAGRIDWNEREITSNGRVTTDALDFAAAFGPVEGLSGTVEFTDLLGLVTAPDQRLRIAAINPGIEVNDGLLTFQLEPDHLLRVHGAKWPFMGGTLTLEPVTMRLGSDETRRYDLVLEGLDAGRFLERIEMENLSATGSFAGTIPIVFDENGGRIEGGSLTSLPPGGNVSYVGELSYEDLGTMGNFAFGALRSLDFKHMRIDLDGSLEGEIFTRVTIDGLGQGKLARRNFLTKQIARLPIRFYVNVRAPFLRLVTSLRSLYDPAYLRNPETLGMLDLPVPPGTVVDPETPAGKSIQPPVSEKMQ